MKIGHNVKLGRGEVQAIGDWMVDLERHVCGRSQKISNGHAADGRGDQVAAAIPDMQGATLASMIIASGACLPAFAVIAITIDPDQLANASGQVTVQYVEPSDTGPVTIAETTAVLR